jgi:4-hydroxythreonine-4-phosphate dehydrogenase
MRPLALTLGEPAGIGPDITLAAWLKRQALALPPFYVLADPDGLKRRARMLGLDVPIETVTAAQAVSVFPRALPVVPLGISATATPGKPDETSAPAAIASIDRAVADVMDGAAAAIATNPIAKSVLYKYGFKDPGHTEYLARLSFERSGDPAWPVMMLWSPEVAVVPVTIHIPFKDVPQHLTRDLIFETGRVVVKDMVERFGIAKPRLAFAGLNPHAGEDGTLGKEDALIVRPAVERLIDDGVDARGPLPADTMFHEAARKTYDVAICMYHDQALIPIKTLAFDHGVNVTLGLPFVRTSPDHGTAFDIAGSGKANPASLVAALKLAARLAAEDDKRRSAAPATSAIVG